MSGCRQVKQFPSSLERNASDVWRFWVHLKLFLSSKEFLMHMEAFFPCSFFFQPRDLWWLKLALQTLTRDELLPRTWAALGSVLGAEVCWRDVWLRRCVRRRLTLWLCPHQSLGEAVLWITWQDLWLVDRLTSNLHCWQNVPVKADEAKWFQPPELKMSSTEHLCSF